MPPRLCSLHLQPSVTTTRSRAVFGATIDTSGTGGNITQGDRKITSAIRKYLLMVAIQYNSKGLMRTQ
jgi:hypothetical protein